MTDTFAFLTGGTYDFTSSDSVFESGRVFGHRPLQPALTKDRRMNNCRKLLICQWISRRRIVERGSEPQRHRDTEKTSKKRRGCIMGGRGCILGGRGSDRAATSLHLAT